MKDNPLKDKSYALALSIVKLCHEISKNTKDYVLINQLLKSGTSIGANIREAEFAQSKADFISKMSIALKEAAETEYWLMLMRDSLIIDLENSSRLIELVTEILKMLVSTVKKSKDNS